MLSKVIRRNAAESVQPYDWQPVAKPASPPQPSATEEKAPAEKPPPPDETPLLRARIAELEALLDKRVKESKDAGYREGMAAGKAQGVAEGAAQVKPVIDKLGESIQQLADFRPTLRLQAESDMVKLALAIARKVVNRELNSDPEAITGLVKVALDKLRLREVMLVRVHPSHVAIVKEILSRSNNGVPVEVTGDASVGLGGLIFETGRGEFDASVDVQLQEIERGLTDRLAS
jgi:flagellar assembly protein FliH